MPISDGLGEEVRVLVAADQTVAVPVLHGRETRGVKPFAAVTAPKKYA